MKEPSLWDFHVMKDTGSGRQWEGSEGPNLALCWSLTPAPGVGGATTSLLAGFQGQILEGAVPLQRGNHFLPGIFPCAKGAGLQRAEKTSFIVP